MSDPAVPCDLGVPLFPPDLESARELVEAALTKSAQATLRRRRALQDAAPGLARA